MEKRPSGVSPRGQEHLRAAVTLTHNAASSRVRTKLLQSVARTVAGRMKGVRDAYSCQFCIMSMVDGMQVEYRASVE
jgi:hypothetical protein